MIKQGKHVTNSRQQEKKRGKKEKEKKIKPQNQTVHNITPLVEVTP